jgi:hypothetical protein
VTDYAICSYCKARVPFELVVEHLAEHGYGTREEIMRDVEQAEIVGEDDDDE